MGFFDDGPRRTMTSGHKLEVAFRCALRRLECYMIMFVPKKMDKKNQEKLKLFKV